MNEGTTAWTKREHTNGITIYVAKMGSLSLYVGPSERLGHWSWYVSTRTVYLVEGWTPHLGLAQELAITCATKILERGPVSDEEPVILTIEERAANGNADLLSLSHAL